MNDPVPNKTITRDQLDTMFANIAKETDWDTSKPMLWGYFFTDGTREPLEKAKLLLEEKGYRYVDIFLADKDEPNEDDIWFLHVEKEEVHSAATLDKRNDELYRFAHKHGLGAYDGMDVGPIKKETANHSGLETRAAEF